MLVVLHVTPLSWWVVFSHLLFKEIFVVLVALHFTTLSWWVVVSHLCDQSPVLVFLAAWPSHTWGSIHQLVSQLLHELSKDARFHVNGKQMKKSPISDTKSARDLVQRLCGRPLVSCATFQCHISKGGCCKEEAVVDEGEKGDNAQDEQPEPEEHVDFLIDDVHGQDTEGIMGLQGSRRTKFLEGALGHSWEYSSHGVNPVFGILLHHASNLDAIGTELPSKEDIHEVDVAKDVEEVDGLGDEHLERPDVVAAQVLHKVTGEHPLLPFSVIAVKHQAI